MGKKNNTDNVNIEPKSERKKPVKKNKVKEEIIRVSNQKLVDCCFFIK